MPFHKWIIANSIPESLVNFCQMVWNASESEIERVNELKKIRDNLRHGTKEYRVYQKKILEGE